LFSEKMVKMFKNFSKKRSPACKGPDANKRISVPPPDSAVQTSVPAPVELNSTVASPNQPPSEAQSTPPSATQTAKRKATEAELTDDEEEVPLARMRTATADARNLNINGFTPQPSPEVPTASMASLNTPASGQVDALEPEIARFPLANIIDLTTDDDDVPFKMRPVKSLPAQTRDADSSKEKLLEGIRRVELERKKADLDLQELELRSRLRKLQRGGR
jgi:hypothetical protein